MQHARYAQVKKHLDVSFLSTRANPKWLRCDHSRYAHLGCKSRQHHTYTWTGYERIRGVRPLCRQPSQPCAPAMAHNSNKHVAPEAPPEPLPCLHFHCARGRAGVSHGSCARSTCARGSKPVQGIGHAPRMHICSPVAAAQPRARPRAALPAAAAPPCRWSGWQRSCCWLPLQPALQPLVDWLHRGYLQARGPM